MSWRRESGFSADELHVLDRLDSPAEIQSYLNALRANFELEGDTCMSPRLVLRTGSAHCVEGAVLAAAAMRLHGRPAQLVELLTTADDDPHVIAIFRERGFWGALGKTNHAVLRYRDAVYKTLRELVMSYFHEYFLNSNGRKTLRSYTRPMQLSQFDKRGWATSEEPVDYIPKKLEEADHIDLLAEWQVRALRVADPIEIDAGKLIVDRKPTDSK